jgi:hypothetical protein
MNMPADPNLTQLTLRAFTEMVSVERDLGRGEMNPYEESGVDFVIDPFELFDTYRAIDRVTPLCAADLPARFRRLVDVYDSLVMGQGSHAEASGPTGPSQ